LKRRRVNKQMITLIVVAAIAVGIFGLVFYQSYRDENRWKRIQSGKSLFGAREEIPPLKVDGVVIGSRERPVVILWADGTSSPFDTVPDARHHIQKEKSRGVERGGEARIFAWDGVEWKQRK
jgi:hypothetical protein